MNLLLIITIKKKLGILDSITVKRNPSSDNELAKKFVDE